MYGIVMAFNKQLGAFFHQVTGIQDLEDVVEVENSNESKSNNTLSMGIANERDPLSEPSVDCSILPLRCISYRVVSI